MRLLNLFFVVPDLEVLSERDWTCGPDLKVNTAFAPPDWNGFDESALELSLRVSDPPEALSGVQRCALTVGGPSCEPFLKTLAALQFDELIRVEPGDADLRFCPEAAARIVKAVAETKFRPDFILTGTREQISESACVPQVTAELLGWPCLTQVMDLHAAGRNRLRVVCAEDGGVSARIVSAPCVLGVGNAPGAYLRVPTLKDKIKYGKKAVTRMTLSDFPETEKPLADPDVRLRSLTRIRKERAGVILDAPSPEEKAEILWERYLEGRVRRG